MPDTRPTPPMPSDSRGALRAELLSARQAWMQSAEGQAAQPVWAQHLMLVIEQLEPEVLGLYWAIRFEFNPVQALASLVRRQKLSCALPFARRDPPVMSYHAWSGDEPVLKDECGIPSSVGPRVVPDVVLVPCVGFSHEGFRLGYGGGYFDRWLQAHPGVTAVGLAWSGSLRVFETQAHDVPLSLIVTERGVFEGA